MELGGTATRYHALLPPQFPLRSACPKTSQWGRFAVERHQLHRASWRHCNSSAGVRKIRLSRLAWHALGAGTLGLKHGTVCDTQIHGCRRSLVFDTNPGGWWRRTLSRRARIVLRDRFDSAVPQQPVAGLAPADSDILD